MPHYVPFMRYAIFKKILRILGKLILCLLLFIGLYLLIGYCLANITIEEEPNAPDEVAIYIVTNGVHTDIVLPVKTSEIDWSRHLLYSHTTAADSTHTYVAMGWGDKGFYLETPTWSDLKTSVAFKAATGLSTTAMHVTYYKDVRESKACKKIMVSKEQYGRLVDHIKASFQQDMTGNFIPIRTTANYGDTDAFYEANGRYSVVTTCNTWANAGLKASGQKACLWTAFDTGIFAKYE